MLEPREETPPTAGDRQPEKKSAAARVCGASCCDTLGASLRCAQCRLVWYCSRQCQKVDWRVHKQTCKCEAAARAAREEQTVLASIKCPQISQSDLTRPAVFTLFLQCPLPSYSVYSVHYDYEGVYSCPTVFARFLTIYTVVSTSFLKCLQLS